VELSLVPGPVAIAEGSVGNVLIESSGNNEIPVSINILIGEPTTAIGTYL